MARGYSLSNLALARIMGASKSTASFWIGVYAQPHLVSWICLLEQISPVERHRVVDELCRDLPVLDHPRLRHNQIMVSMLKSILGKNSGLTFVTGGNEQQRTFLLTALGHNFCRTDRLHQTPAGIDVHEPTWFVPIESMLYLRQLCNNGLSLAAVRKVWPNVRSSKAPLILLNGVWSMAPDLRKEIISLAVTRHVIVAEQDVPTSSEPFLRTANPIHTLKVSNSRENPSWLVVSFEAQDQARLINT